MMSKINENIIYSVISIFDQLEMPIIITDKVGITRGFNKSFSKIFGDVTNEKITEEIEFKDDTTILTKEELPFIKAIKHSKNLSEKIYFIKLNEIERSFTVNSLVSINDKTEIQFVLTYFRDVGKLSQNEKYILEASKQIDLVIFSSDLSGNNYYFISDIVEKILGFTQTELENNHFIILRKVHPNDFHKVKLFLKKLKNGQAGSIEFRFFDKIGHEHYLFHSVKPIEEQGEIKRVSGVIFDITKQKNTESDLSKAEEKFKLLIETASDLIFVLDGYGYFTNINKNGALALKYKPEEMIGRHFLEFVDDDNKANIAQAFQRILKSDIVVSFEVELRNKFNEKNIFEIQARNTRVNQQITSVIAIGRDISLRRKDEIKLRELNSKLIETNRLLSIERDRAKQQVSGLEELNKLKNDFISNVSHELRTPLASIVGFSETIASDPDLPKDMVMEFTNIILSESKRLAKVINDILDFSKLEEKKTQLSKTYFNIITLLNIIIDNYSQSAKEKEITLSREIPDTEILIFADKEKISKVLNNIISNSMKFTDLGGRVSIILQNFVNEVEIIIIDTGMGIPEDELNNIFQVFYKVNRPGTQIPGAGMGLVTAKQIIELHKGIINIKSEINRGTTVIIKLPKIA